MPRFREVQSRINDLSCRCEGKDIINMRVMYITITLLEFGPPPDLNIEQERIHHPQNQCNYERQALYEQLRMHGTPRTLIPVFHVPNSVPVSTPGQTITTPPGLFNPTTLR